MLCAGRCYGPVSGDKEHGIDLLHDLPGLCEISYNLTRPVPSSKEQIACMIKAGGVPDLPILTNYSPTDCTANRTSSDPSIGLDCDQWRKLDPNGKNKDIVVDPDTKRLAVMSSDYNGWLLFQCDDYPRY